MKMPIIGAVILVLVLGVLFVITGGLESLNSETEVTDDQPAIVEPADAPQEPGNKNFNL
jgi:hypothetical protein